MLTEPTLTRRGFVKVGGALIATIVVVPDVLTPNGARAEGAVGLDATKLSSWLEIRADGRVIARTGRTEIGIGMTAYFAQMIAEELSVDPTAISLIMGDTDQTPDGGRSATLLDGAENLRKVAAYTSRALLSLASARLRAPVAALSVSAGVVSGGGRRVSYADLVKGQQLVLTIPVSGGLAAMNDTGTAMSNSLGVRVTGNPPMKSVADYKVIGQSFPSPSIAEKVTARTTWVADLRLPGMLHARIVRPPTLGSTLIASGRLDRSTFPGAEVVKTGNLVAVVSPNEWEAVSASRALAIDTTWTDWSGLPEQAVLGGAIRAHAQANTSRGDRTETESAFASAAKVVSTTYEQPYVKHAPIGPYIAVADVKSDGATVVWTHSADMQSLRAHLAYAFDIPREKVTVRWLEGAAQFGRTSLGGDGAEADAVALSRLLGRPVRVQWTLQEDFAWSSASPAWVADLKAALDSDGRLLALQSDYYAPHQSDYRMLGAVLAGFRQMPQRPMVGPPTFGVGAVAMPYAVPHMFHQAHGAPSFGFDAPSGVGLRGNIMRTPHQRQHVCALESLLNETAAAAGRDPIQFRLEHTREQRLIDVIKKTAAAAAWQSRPSPGPNATHSGDVPVKGRGMAAMYRFGSYWAGVAEVEVVPSTGVVKVTKFTIGVDPGKVINPRLLRRIIEGGVVMGLGEALTEELTFDRSKVTSTDWSRYKIMTMTDTPDINVVTVDRDDVGFGGVGEAANSLPQPAVLAAVYDATGVQPRRTPLTPGYLKSIFRG